MDVAVEVSAAVVGLESVLCVFSDEDSGVKVGAFEAVNEGATAAGEDVVVIGLVATEVTVGTLFWRYSRGCRAFSMSVALEKMAKKSRKAYAELWGWNMMMWRCFGR